MKKPILFLLGVLLVAAASAQAPKRFSYQAVLRDGSGAIEANTSATLGIALLQGGSSGTVVYSETHAVTSNGFGLVNVSIGGGTVVSGDINTVDWSTGPYYVRTSLNGTEMGTTQLLSVPYALFADESNTPGPAGPQGPAGDANINGTADHLVKFNGPSSGINSQVVDNGTNVGIGTTSPSAKLDVEGSFQLKDGSQGADKVLTSDADGNASWQPQGNAASREYGVYQDRKFNGADGGSQAANTWGKRTLNTTLAEVGTSIHRIGDTLRLAPGTYHIVASAPGYRCAEHAIKLYNTTDATDEIWGTSMFASYPYYVENTTRIDDILTVTGGTKKYIILQFTRSTAPDNLGSASNANGGNPSIFTRVFIERF